MKLKVTCSRGEPGEPALLYSQRLCSPLITARVPSTGGHHSHQGYIRHGYTDSTASPCCSVTDHILQYVMIRNGLTLFNYVQCTYSSTILFMWSAFPTVCHKH